MKQKTMTRAQAEKLVASTDDEEVLSKLLGHPNKHVRSKVAFKRASSPEARRAATAIKYFAVILQNLSAPMPAPASPSESAAAS